MHQVKFNGVLQKILDQPNVDVVELLQDELRLPLDKAEVLAKRIEKEYIQTADKEHKIHKNIVEKQLDIKQAKETVYVIESLSTKEFENFTKWLLQELGYDIHPEKIQTILGVDYIATRNGTKTAVLARKFPKTCVVSETVVLMAQQAKRIYQCENVIVLATTAFSEQAILDAENVGVELWDAYMLDEKICEVKKKAEQEVQAGFPSYKGNLLDSLLGLEERKDFMIEKRAGEKYDVYFPGVKFPLLTFQVQNGVVSKLVYRIKYNESVGENDGETLIKCDRNGVRFGPEDAEAYAQVTEFLEQFLE
ncbi:MAG: restriction endonuclease [Candidatus Bathyarchaeia archaeon]